MPLTDTAIRKAVPGSKSRKLSDGKGLYLELSPAGGKWWRLKYRIAGVEKRISLGTYPDISLKAAREKTEEARALIAQSIDPSQLRKVAKQEAAHQDDQAHREAQGLPTLGSFEEVACEWFETRKDEWASSYANKIFRRLEVDVFPWLGKLPVNSITPPMVLEVLRRAENRGALETAHRVLETCGQVFRFAVAKPTSHGPVNAPRLNHSRDKCLIAVNLNEFVEMASERRQQVPPLAELKKVLRTSKTRRFVDAARVVKSAIKSNSAGEDAGKTVRCWVFEVGG